MKRWFLPAVLYGVMAVALTAPVIARLASAFPHDAGDPVLNTWILWWSTEHLPFTASWWNAPMFHPMANAMALSEVLIGLLPLSAPVQWLTGSPLVAYNVAFCLSFPLCGLAAYALALDITGRRDAAFLAGVAFVAAPYRMSQLAHLQMLSYYWAPVALLGLHRYARTARYRWLALFAAGWLMQALSNGYALFHLSVFVLLWIVWFMPSIRAAAPIALAWLSASLPLIPLLWKYREVHSALHLVRDINEIKRFGVDLADFLSAPPDVIVWGSRLWTARPETAVFPGATILAIGSVSLAVQWWRGRSDRTRPSTSHTVLVAISGVAALVAFSTITYGPWAIGLLTVSDFHKPFSIAIGARLVAFLIGPWMRRAWQRRSVEMFYVVAMVLAYVLALGPEPRAFGHPLLYEPPYAWLMRLPGFDVLRVPARFAMLAVLFQSVLLACAVTRWTALTRRPVLVAAVCAGLLADGWIRLPTENAPATSSADWSGVSAVLELPPGGARDDFAAIYRGMSHRRPIVNGYSGYNPPHYLPLVFAIRDGQYAALQDLTVAGPLGIAVNPLVPDKDALERSLVALDGVERGRAHEGWSTFVLRPRPQPGVRFGPDLPIAGVRANRHPEDVARMLDERVETAWSSGPSQIGDEEVVVDLGSLQTVGAVELSMGAYAFGFPRELAIDAAPTDGAWTTVWTGPTSALTVHAAVRAPGSVPLTLELGQVSARFLRFRQTGAEPGIPWWIADLGIYSPAPASR